MVAFTTAPPAPNAKRFTSVQPPAKSIRTGARLVTNMVLRTSLDEILLICYACSELYWYIHRLGGTQDAPLTRDEATMLPLPSARPCLSPSCPCPKSHHLYR